MAATPTSSSSGTTRATHLEVALREYQSGPSNIPLRFRKYGPPPGDSNVPFRIRRKLPTTTPDDPSPDPSAAQSWSPGLNTAQQPNRSVSEGDHAPRPLKIVLPAGLPPANAPSADRVIAALRCQIFVLRKMIEALEQDDIRRNEESGLGQCIATSTSPGKTRSSLAPTLKENLLAAPAASVTGSASAAKKRKGRGRGNGWSRKKRSRAT
ncbi:hypothetical protein BV20DRAFT_1055002 [Pilatotrama ljubarskyi]|nr:hypothetical protein BV20DRAFT_1055002 [Pilatotrama ljubarskyi]